MAFHNERINGPSLCISSHSPGPVWGLHWTWSNMREIKWLLDNTDLCESYIFITNKGEFVPWCVRRTLFQFFGMWVFVEKMSWLAPRGEFSAQKWLTWVVWASLPYSLNKTTIQSSTACCDYCQLLFIIVTIFFTVLFTSHSLNCKDFQCFWSLWF